MVRRIPSPPSWIASPYSPLTPAFPPAAYFDPATLEWEMATLFTLYPQYVGHRLQVPNPGSFHTPDFDGSRVLVNDAGTVRLLSNICRHRQATMLKGRGNLGGVITCPLHNWSYRTDGSLLNAPHFKNQPCAQDHRLQDQPLEEWQGVLFTPGQDKSILKSLETLRHPEYFDFSQYRYHSSQTHQCGYDWKTFVEVYLEDYHVEPFHPGLGNFVACKELDWQFAPHFSLQSVGLKVASSNSRSGPVYQHWHETVNQHFGTTPPPFGAQWFLLYPNVMLEWYPGTLTVSTLWPQGVDKTLNVIDFFYEEEIALFEPEFIAAQQAAYCQTMIEDDEIALRMCQGRRALLHQGQDQRGPYQSPMEDGMTAFHHWYRNIAAHHFRTEQP